MTNRPARWSPEGYAPPEPEPAGEPPENGRLPVVGDIVLIQIDPGAAPVPAIIRKVNDAERRRPTVSLTAFGDGGPEQLDNVPYGIKRGYWHWRPEDEER